MKLRDRLILPGVVSNEKLADCSMEAQIVFRDLPMIADREGRLEDRPRRIRAVLRPYDDWDMNTILQELADAGFIGRYSVNGIDCISILTFTKHQSVHWKEKKSELPQLQQLPQDQSNLKSTLSQGKSKLDPSLQVEVEVKEEVEVEVKVKEEVVPYLEIIGHLNQLTGKNYNLKAEGTKKWIRARWREGHRLEAFLHVNQVKALEWLDTDMEQYLRPKTLYSRDNFESYRNQRVVPGAQLSDRVRKNKAASLAFLKKHGVLDAEAGQGQINSDTQQDVRVVPERHN